MPLLEIKESRKVTATVSLEQSIATLVDRYAAFTNSIADDVVNQSLEYVFSRDKEFQKFLENPGDKRAKAELRIKRSGGGAQWAAWPQTGIEWQFRARFWSGRRQMNPRSNRRFRAN